MLRAEDKHLTTGRINQAGVICGVTRRHPTSTAARFTAAGRSHRQFFYTSFGHVGGKLEALSARDPGRKVPTNKQRELVPVMPSKTRTHLRPRQPPTAHHHTVEKVAKEGSAGNRVDSVPATEPYDEVFRARRHELHFAEKGLLTFNEAIHIDEYNRCCSSTGFVGGHCLGLCCQALQQNAQRITGILDCSVQPAAVVSCLSTSQGSFAGVES